MKALEAKYEILKRHKDVAAYKRGATSVNTVLSYGVSLWVKGDPQEKIDKLALKGCEFFIFNDEFAATVRKAQEKEYCKTWIETDREDFLEMLEVLPPENWTRGVDTEAFRMSEYWTGTITSHYVRIGDRYFTAKRPAKQAILEYVKEIVKQFQL